MELKCKFQTESKKIEVGGNRGGNVHIHVVPTVATNVYTTKNLQDESKQTSHSSKRTIEGKKQHIYRRFKQKQLLPKINERLY